MCLLTFFSDAIMEHRQTQILQTLDKGECSLIPPPTCLSQSCGGGEQLSLHLFLSFPPSSSLPYHSPFFSFLSYLYSLSSFPPVAEEVNNPLIVCRIYACIADVLAFMAGPGGIRAGPAANLSWRTAFNLLEVQQRDKSRSSLVPRPRPASVTSIACVLQAMESWAGPGNEASQEA